jgi:osmotically inducible protein OsmC
MIRKATAVWRGTGRAGNGDLTTESGVLSQTPYSFKSRFENSRGSNTEELLAAAHAGCFTMAVAFRLQAAGYTATELTTQAAVEAVPDEQGSRVASSALSLRARIPGIDALTFDNLTRDAKQYCPISRVLRAEITLDAALI